MQELLGHDFLQGADELRETWVSELHRLQNREHAKIEQTDEILTFNSLDDSSETEDSSLL